MAIVSIKHVGIYWHLHVDIDATIKSSENVIQSLSFQSN